MAARRQVLQIAAQAIERRFNSDTSDHKGRPCHAPADMRRIMQVGDPRLSRPRWEK